MRVSNGNALGMETLKDRDKRIREKMYCPVCGSTVIRPFRGGYICLNCRSLFPKPRKTRIELRKRPRYIR